MHMLTRLLALFSFLLPASTHAVSLGDELILSRLGDPVEIEIEVLQWEDMDLDRVQISAATEEEYDVFNLTWLPVLEDLNFNLVGPDLDGDVRVLISSRDPLNEPFLELLLVLRWPGGSLRREYVLLFDPPGAPALLVSPVVVSPPVATLVRTVPLPPVEEPEPAAAAVLVETPAAPVVVEEERLPAAEMPAPVPEEPIVVMPAPAIVASPEPVIAEPEPTPVLEPAAPVVAVVEEDAAPEPEPVVTEPEESAVPDARTQVAIDVETLAPQAVPVALDSTRRTHQVRSGDSLWNIARQYRPAGAGENLYQMLLSIHNLNRSSFINGNISLLKANAVLQIPTVDDINRIAALGAEAEFDRRWNEGTQRFDAVQRGEPIPLFVNEVPPEEMPEVEQDLPPGEEAPLIEDDENALIMVSPTTVPQPLQLAGDVAAADAQAEDPDTAAEPLLAPTPVPIVVQTETITVADAPPTVAEATSGTVQRTVTRAVLTAELETEVAAMRARRESAEAVAAQLNASLQRARAEREAQASLFGKENLLLAASALGLFAALLAAVVFSLRIAGDLRLRNSIASDTTLDAQPEPEWFATATSKQRAPSERKEPHMPEMEVVELELPDMEPRTSGQKGLPGGAKHAVADDLFARMDDILDTRDGNSGKNS